jgi:hypothetical protein
MSPVVVAVLSVAAVVAAVTYALSLHPGSVTVPPGTDYKIMIWAPVRGLTSGYNVYDPSSLGYLAHFAVRDVATPHAPSLLLIFGWTALLPFRLGYVVFAAVNVLALTLAAVAMAAAPTVRKGTGLSVVLVMAVVVSEPGRVIVALGQVTGVVALGVVMTVLGGRTWVVVTGVVLMSFSPQTAIPVTLLLIAMPRRRGLFLGWAITCAAGLPVAVVAAVNAGGAGELVSAVRSGTSHLVNVNRIDLPYLAPTSGLVSLAVGLLALGLAAAFLAGPRRHQTQWWGRGGPFVAAFVSAVALVSVYHQPYDMALLLLAAAAYLASGPPGSRSATSLTGVGVSTTLLVVSSLTCLYQVFELTRLAGVSGLYYWPYADLALGSLVALVSAAAVRRTRSQVLNRSLVDQPATP